MSKRVRLSVNVDHVATLRQARGTDYPSPLEGARLALEGRAEGITIHLRSDRRHIQESDVIELCRELETKINLEMATTEEMIDIALELRPDQVTLVPERPEEVTTEGGLDLAGQMDRVLDACRRLRQGGIGVSLFIDPEEHQIDSLLEAPQGLIEGFEINTDAYAQAATSETQESQLELIRLASERGSAAGFKVYAGHALTTENVGPIAAIPEVEELNIGHFLIGRAVMVGMREAVAEMLAAIAATSAS